MIDTKSTNLTKPIAITAKAYSLAASERDRRKLTGLSASITAVVSEAVVKVLGNNG